MDNKLIEKCVDDCLSCYRECSTCLTHCISLGGDHVESKHLNLMMECAEVCRTSVELMLRQSQFSMEMCELCAKVCDACAESCSSIDADDSMMEKCAQVCRQCAESCREMARQQESGSGKIKASARSRESAGTSAQAQ